MRNLAGLDVDAADDTGVVSLVAISQPDGERRDGG